MLSRDGGTEISVPSSQGRGYLNLSTLREDVVSESQYQALERWYLNLNTMLSREGGTENLLPYSREEVVPKFHYYALEGPWYLNFSTEHSRDGGI